MIPGNKKLYCQKCGAISGDGWDQCNFACPIGGSPHFNSAAFAKFGGLQNTPPDLGPKPKYERDEDIEITL